MALQKPLIIYPSNDVTIDATDTVTFYCYIRGTQCVKYTIYIYDIATNTEQYTDTQTLASTLYDGDKLEIDVDMSALGADSYYWQVDLYYTSSDYITSDYKTFIASTPPTCVFSPSIPSTITSPTHTFVCAYTQAEGVMVKYFTINIYDSTYDGSTNPDDHLVATSGTIEDYPNNIRFTANGLVSNQSYQVQCVGMTQGNVEFSTTLTAFDVSYIVPSSLAHPSAVLNTDSSITITWGNIVAITGSTSGTVSYESDYLYTGNYGLNMAASAYVQFDVDFSPPFTFHWVCTPASGFTGVLGEAQDTAGTYYIYLGYDGTRFYLNVNGNYYYDASETLTTNPYILAIIHDGINISIYHREVA